MRICKILILLLANMCGFQTVRATHIIGGEITYECLGNDQFQVNLTVFRDCYNGVPPFDSPASIGVYDSSWNYLFQYLIPYTSDDTLPITLTDPCLQVPPNVCVHRSEYTTTANLPFRAGGYKLVYQRCCRNQLIQNIYDPEATGASFVAEITEASLLGCNNSAVFRQWPPVAICINQPIEFDHGATDADGDSLVYKLCTPNSGATTQDPMPQPPYAGPYDPVLWITPPYNLSNVLGGTPLQIDPVTGWLTGVPNRLGNFVVGICVEEYRNGQLISSTNRDFQYNVADCGIVSAAFFTPQLHCDTLKVGFANTSGTSSGYQWFFDWPNQTPTSSAISPSFTYPDTGTYTVALIVNPGLACTDTAFRTIELKKITIEPEFEITTGTCDSLGLQVTVSNLAADSIHGVTWVRWLLEGPDGAKNLADWEPMFTINKSGTYQLTITVKSNNGCTLTQTKTFEVPIPDLASLDTMLQVCLGQSVALFPGFQSDNTYSWSPPFFLDNPNIGNPVSTPSANITYQLQATDPVSGCTSTGEVAVAVSQPGTAVVVASPDLVLPGGTSQLNYTGDPAQSVVWLPDPTLSATNIPNPVATPVKDSTWYTLIAAYGGGCFDTAQVLVRLLTPICDEPYVFLPTAFSPNADMENDDLGLEGNYVDAMSLVIYDRWGELVFETNEQSKRWDGTFRGKDLPPDTYGYYLKVGCIGGGVFEKKGNITLLR